MASFLIPFDTSFLKGSARGNFCTQKFPLASYSLNFLVQSLGKFGGVVDVDIGKFVDTEDFVGARGEKNGVEVANIGMVFNDILPNIACAFFAIFQLFMCFLFVLQIILIAVELDGGNVSFGVTFIAAVRGLVFLIKDIERNAGIKHRVIGEGREAVD